MIELATRNRPEEICDFLTSAPEGEDSLQALDEANALITPVMEYIRQCKGK